MKLKFTISLFAFILPFLGMAKDNTKEFVKLIQKYDIPEEARNLSSTATCKEFWQKTIGHNPELLNLLHDLKKNRGAEKEAGYAINRMKLIDYRLDVDIIPSFAGYCDTLALDMGLPTEYFDLNIIDDITPNAFTVQTKKGFAICLHIGLLERLDYDYGRIMAVTAHEFAHGILQHHLREEYRVAKERRKNKILGGIAAGMTALAAGADAYASGVTGEKYDSEKYSKQIEKIANDVNISTLKYRYRYGREQELEADLIAQRFMQFLGYDNKYLEALQLITNSEDYFWFDEDSDHPSTIYRLEFLDFVNKNPQYTNQQKIKTSKVAEKPKDKFGDPIYD